MPRTAGTITSRLATTPAWKASRRRARRQAAATRRWNAAAARARDRTELLRGDSGPRSAETPQRRTARLASLCRALAASTATLMNQLGERGIATAIHYPTPVPFQPAYAHLGYRRGDFPVAEAIADGCLSLPMYPELTLDDKISRRGFGRLRPAIPERRTRSSSRMPGDIAASRDHGTSRKTVLVTGGAGFIGSHLVDALGRLLGARARRLFDRQGGELARRRRPDVEVIRGDMRDASRSWQAVRDVDVVFHLACRGVRHSIGNPCESHEVNAEGTLALLGRIQASRRRAVRARFVVRGLRHGATLRWTRTTRRFPETVYGAAKLAGESYARAYHQTYGLPTVVVRPFNNFGPRSHHEGDSGEVIPRFVVWALNG